MTIKQLNIKEPEPIRYFKSDFLEKFTHVKLWHVISLWVSVGSLTTAAAYFLGGRSQDSSYSFMMVLILINIFLILGALRWTLLEYLLHRFLFHYEGENKILQRIAWTVHGIHHTQPTVSSRLLTPPAASLGVGLVIAFFDWLFFGVILGQGWLGYAFISGTAWGHILYDVIHWSGHFLDIDNKVLRSLRKNHMRHHRTHNKRYGVSTTLWDHIFGTYPKEESEKQAGQSEVEPENPRGDEPGEENY